jgi:hypothetical protein
MTTIMTTHVPEVTSIDEDEESYPSSGMSTKTEDKDETSSAYRTAHAKLVEYMFIPVEKLAPPRTEVSVYSPCFSIYIHTHTEIRHFDVIKNEVLTVPIEIDLFD